MGDEQGYDDQFNDGLFQTTLHASRRERPDMWPKSVSEMRNHTSYGGQGMTPGHETGHSDYVGRRPYASGAPYHHQPKFYKPFWHDRAHPKTGNWHGYGGRWYHDPSRGGWIWIDSAGSR